MNKVLEADFPSIAGRKVIVIASLSRGRLLRMGLVAVRNGHQYL